MAILSSWFQTKKIVEIDEFETDDPGLKGEMTMTFTLKEKNGNTELIAMHENLPPGLSAHDNAIGWRMALNKLATLVEETGKPL